MEDLNEGMIINGDAIEELERLPAGIADLIFADPPYWMRTEGRLVRVEGTAFDGCDDGWDQFGSLEEYEEFTEKWLLACRRALKPTGSIWVIGGMQCIYTIGSIMQRLGFWIINDVVWHKRNPTPNFKGTRLNNSHETMIWASREKGARFTFHYKTAKELNADAVSPEEYSRGVRKQMGSVWRFPVCSGDERLRDENGGKLHSTQKPLAMLKRIVAISSNVGDVVLDPFAGTMTTGAAAKELGRKYIMIERDKKYCEHGRNRLDGLFEFMDDGPVARAAYDEKPPRAPLRDMIAAGFLTAGEWFCLEGKGRVATLKENGRLCYGGEEADIHSCAARALGLKAPKVNGFDRWLVERDGAMVPISRIRDDFRKASLAGGK